MRQPTSRRRLPGLRAYLPGVRRTALLALACNGALELSQLTQVEGYPWRFKTPWFPLLFLLSSLVLWSVVALVHAVVGRFWLTAVLVATATGVVAFADLEKMRLRREPLLPSDWRFIGDPGFLVSMVGRQVLLVLGLGFAVVGAVAVVAVRRWRGRRPPAPARRLPGTRRSRFALRLLTIVLCLGFLHYVTDFNARGNAARATYDALGASWRSWSQERNYVGNGFLAGTLYNLDVPPMRRPPGYGPATMARIVARYTAAARAINASRSRPGLRGVNVVTILSESFSDPGRLRGVRPAEDPIPLTRALMRRTTSGSMLAQNVGGGTANMEFEALTGMSVSLFPAQLGVPYQMVVPRRAGFPSAVRWLKSEGHRAVAIHPFTTEMYRRREVYHSFGFDAFVHDTTMHSPRRLGHHGYISDRSAFSEALRNLRGAKDPLLLNVVTMQNHMPYGGRYDDPLDVRGPGGKPMDDIGQYARGLTYTDRALHGFLDGLRHLGEPTVVVFYGDHLPGVYPDSVFEDNTARALHQTPFLVWASFAGPRRQEPVTSPIFFMDLALERADATVPPYYAMLHLLRQQVPAMDGGMTFDARGHLVRGTALPADARRLMRDYRLVQYDLSFGSRYSEEPMFRDVR
jgi:Sulfatase